MLKLVLKTRNYHEILISVFCGHPALRSLLTHLTRVLEVSMNMSSWASSAAGSSSGGGAGGSGAWGGPPGGPNFCFSPQVLQN